MRFGRPGSEMHRVALRTFWVLAVALTVFFVAETWFELWRTGVRFGDLELSTPGARGLATTVSRAFNNLLAMVLSFVSIAIPITANMYTPKLIEIFFRDRLNLVCLAWFAAMGAHAIYAHWVILDGWAPATHAAVLWISGAVGFLIVVPYYLYVLDFLNPTAIIGRVRDRVVDAFPPPGDGGSAASRRLLADRVLELGNVVLRAVDRADRDVAIQAIGALESAISSFAERKPALDAAWFDVEREVFPGFSKGAVELLRRDRTWVEHACLQQLHLAYQAALARMPDAVGAISKVNRRVARAAAQRGDDATLALALRFLNTFVRTAIARRDAHAVFDVFHQYRELAIELLPLRPELTPVIASRMRYYAALARHQGLAFVYEVAASEVAELVQAAFAAGAPSAVTIFAEMRGFRAVQTSPRLTKAEASLASWLREAGRTTEFETVRRELLAARTEDMETARRDFAATEDPVFWEVTDRQTNLDYLPPERRAAVLTLLDEILDEKRGGAAGG